jgi:glycosyltransferase involved in cell wall biosynthesis
MSRANSSPPSLTILASPAYYTLDPNDGSEVGWTLDILNRVNRTHSVHAVTGYDARTNKNFPATGIWPRRHKLNHVRRLTFTTSIWRAGFRTKRQLGHVDVLHHVLPFAYGRTYNLLALVGARKTPFVIGPVQQPFTGDMSDESNVESRDLSNKRSWTSAVDRLLEAAAFIPKKLSDATVRRADVIVCVSEAAKQLALQVDPDATVLVAPPGVDVSKYTPAPPNEQTVNILVGSYLIKRKQVDLVIRAVHELDKRQVRCNLRIVGDGPDRERLEKLTSELGIAHLVQFKGLVPYHEMVAEYHDAAVFCFVSREEAAAMAPIEAMACGVPVVATATGIAPLLLGNTGAGTIVPSDPTAIASALQHILENPRVRLDMAKAARRTIEDHFDWEHIVATYLHAYDSAMQLRGRTPVRT